MTGIPDRFVAELDLQPVGEEEIGGVLCEPELHPIYIVSISFDGKAFQDVAVFSHRRLPYVILGRDVLNGMHLTLDGPGQELAIR